MPYYTLLLTFLTTLLLAFGSLTPRPARAEAPPLDTPVTPIATAQSAGVYIEGQVSERFGNSFILEDPSGRVLVDTWPEEHSDLTLKAGDQVGVFGRPDGQRIQARWLVIDTALMEVDEPRLSDIAGNRLNRSAPIAAPSIEERLEGEAFFQQRVETAGYQPLGGVEYKPRHVELRAINPYGEEVELHVDFSGDIYKERHRD